MSAKKKEKPISINRAKPIPAIHYLTKESPLHRALLGMTLERIREFTKKYPATDSNGDILAQWVDEDFVKQEPQTVVFVAERDGKVVAHFFGALMKNEMAAGKLYLHLLQWEMDRNHGLPRDLEMAVWEQMMEWGRNHNAEWVSLECDDPGLCDRYEREYGFTPRRIVMRREL